ncbi:hemagglutinin repeat-containing protein [Stenotrophomonas indicatrix]|uniref:hemagglutinin repeat-containing protein n=1 Tax=Stenotrophomonas indicatrix TaxID=2045451 RepID=UPI001C6FCCAD|nr:hemagglutinin repeat-containing protein [Stenotrophomonas indicatrix]
MLLEAGKAHVADRSKSSNAGAEVGVGVVVGAQTGVYVYAEASVGSSKANSDSNTWQNTTLTGQNISLKAEGDTTLRGATATADRIDVKTGGTLTIESLQDIAESMSKNSQVGGACRWPSVMRGMPMAMPAQARQRAATRAWASRVACLPATVAITWTLDT